MLHANSAEYLTRMTLVTFGVMMRASWMSQDIEVWDQTAEETRNVGGTASALGRSQRLCTAESMR